MTTRDALYCPACGVAVATIQDGQLITEGPLSDDGDCLDWFAQVIALPKPPLFASHQYLKGQCHACDHGLYWLEVSFAVLPDQNMTWVEADGYIGELPWVCSDFRLEEAREDSPWGWLSAQMALEEYRGQHHLIGPFSMPATAFCSPDGYGPYYLFRNILNHYWEDLLQAAKCLSL